MPRVVVNLLQSTGKKGGIEAYIRELYQQISSMEHEFEFIGFGSREICEQNDLAWFPGRIIDSGISGENRYQWAFAELFLVNRFAKSVGADIIHGPAMFGPLKSTVPTVITMHDLSYFTHPELMQTPLYTLPVKLMERVGAKNAKRIISISAETALNVEKYLKVSPREIDTIYSAGRPLGISPRMSSDRKVGHFLAMGQRSPYKSLETAVLAWAKMDFAQRPKLTITGSHGFDPLAELVARYKLESHIELLSWVSDAELSSLMSNATALIETTVAAGFGMPALEAMSIGMPVITTDIPVFREILGDAAAYYEAGNIENLAELVLMLDESPEVLARFSDVGLERSYQYSWERCATETLSSFRLAMH